MILYWYNIDTPTHDVEPSASGCDLLEDEYVTEVADIGGCTDSVYKLDLNDHIASWGTNKKNNNNSIFLICKKVSDEALDVLYGENAFELYLPAVGDIMLEQEFADTNRGRMRYLLLTAEARYCCISAWTPKIALWSSIIPTLRILRLVAKQPVYKTDTFPPYFNIQLDEWVSFPEWPISQSVSHQRNAVASLTD